MEEKKISIFKKIENSFLLQVVFFVVSMVVIVGAYALMTGHAKKTGEFKTIKETKVQEDYNILVSVEKAETMEGVLQLSGWAMRLDSVTKRVHLVLREVGGKEEFVLETKLSARKDVEEYFKQDSDFGRIGFNAEIEKKELKADTCYEIIVYLMYETMQENEEGLPILVDLEKKIAGGMYLYNGELVRYNPLTLELPKFEDTFMREVVDKGELYFYGAEEDAWIYEYQGTMYWIAGEKFAFNEAGRTYIPGHVYTTEFDKIPERMKDIRRFGYDFIFEEREMTLDKNDQSYRVAFRMLQGDCIITWMRTGLYDPESSEWIWQVFIPIMKQIEAVEKK